MSASRHVVKAPLLISKSQQRLQVSLINPAIQEFSKKLHGPEQIKKISKAKKLKKIIKKETILKNTLVKKTAQTNTKREFVPISQKASKRVVNPEIKNKLHLYAAELRQFIENNKFYPRVAKRLKQSGKVKLNLKVTKDGIFEDVSLASSSQFPLLNKAAIELVKKLKKFKPLPSTVQKYSFSIPIKYQL